MVGMVGNLRLGTACAAIISGSSSQTNVLTCLLTENLPLNPGHGTSVKILGCCLRLSLSELEPSV